MALLAYWIRHDDQRAVIFTFRHDLRYVQMRWHSVYLTLSLNLCAPLHTIALQSSLLMREDIYLLVLLTRRRLRGSGRLGGVDERENLAQHLSEHLID